MVRDALNYLKVVLAAKMLNLVECTLIIDKLIFIKGHIELEA
jgi:hypothetical protein